jgi:hypothetical protein
MSHAHDMARDHHGNPTDIKAYLNRLLSPERDAWQMPDRFHTRELPIGPPLEHKLAREDFLKAARRAGLQLVDEVTFLPHQYFLSLGFGTPTVATVSERMLRQIGNDWFL